MSGVQSNNTLREWSESAQYWEKHAPTLRMIFAPVTRALIEEASIVAGQTVLDVAAGAGEPSLTSATLREKLLMLSLAERSRMIPEVEKAARGFFPEGTMSFPAQMIIVTGKKREK